MALHQVDGVLHQHIALHLHNRSWRGPHKHHQEVIAGILFAVTLVFIKLFVVERHLNSGAQ